MGASSFSNPITFTGPASKSLPGLLHAELSKPSQSCKRSLQELCPVSSGDLRFQVCAFSFLESSLLVLRFFGDPVGLSSLQQGVPFFSSYAFEVGVPIQLPGQSPYYS